MPTDVKFGHRIKDIAAGRHHSLAVTETGEVFGCGRGNSGELGIPIKKTHEFVRVFSLKNAVADKVFAGGFHTFVAMNKQRPKRTSPIS